MDSNSNYDESGLISNHEKSFLEDIKENGRFVLAIGKKGSGKTYLMTNVLKWVLLNNAYKFIIFVCPCYSGEANDSYAFMANQKHIMVYKHYSESVAKKVDEFRKKGPTLFLIDDASGELLKKMDNTLVQIITTTRHFKGCTLYIAVHSCRKVLSPIIRQNIDGLFIYSIINMKLLQDLYEEYFSSYFDRFVEFKRWFLMYTEEEFSCIHFGMKTKGLDPFVKHWNVNRQMPDKFGPTKSIAANGKDKKQEPKNQPRNFRLLFKKGKLYL